MEKSKLLKLIISLCLITMTLLPRIGKELFVSNTGKISHPDGFFIIVIIFGLFAEWKYLKEILLGIIILLFISTTLWVISGTMNEGWSGIKLGFYINLFPFLTMMASLFNLRKIEKLMNSKKIHQQKT